MKNGRWKKKREENKKKKEMKSTSVIFLSALPNHCTISFWPPSFWQQRCSHLNCYCHIYVMHNSSVAAFKIFSSNLNITCLCMDICFFLGWSLFGFLNVQVYVLGFQPNLGVLNHYLFKYFFSSAIFLLSFWDSKDTNVKTLRSLELCSLFFTLCCSA